MKYIYIIRNTIDDKVYIGQTKNPVTRKTGHFGASRHPSRRYPLHHAIHKYGETNFDFHIIDECEDEEADEREKYWIAQFESTDRDKGYNIRAGGSGMPSCGHSRSEWRRKLSERAKSRTGEKGSVFGKLLIHKSKTNMFVPSEELNFWILDGWVIGANDDAKRNISAGHFGRHHRDEVKKKMSLAKIGNRHCSDRCWVSNAEQQTTRMVRKEELDSYLTTGWKLGRLVHGWVWVCDVETQTTYRVLEEELTSYLSRGFHRGRK